ncbi:chalcone isomerase family protein [Myxococcaceae bacterium GXIMD 01537]
METRWLLLGALLAAGAAQAKQLAGVKMPELMELDGRELRLAHMELHEKLWFDVYVWGLYLEQIPRRTSDAISSNGVKRLQFRFLRNIKREQLVGAFRDGLMEHSALRAPGLRQDLERLLASLQDVADGDDLVLTYIPGAGLHVSGRASGGILIPGKRFADALFTVWLESHPIFKDSDDD